MAVIECNWTQGAGLEAKRHFCLLVCLFNTNSQQNICTNKSIQINYETMA